jgi:NADH-quinone oxidoreductase subunit N
MAAALLCLLLEAAGTPIGFRKRGARTHLPWIIAVAGAFVVARALVSWGTAGVVAASTSAVVFDRPGLFACALIAIVVVAAHFAAVPELRALDEERGEMSAAMALLGAALSLVAVADDLIVVAVGLCLAATSLALLAAPDRDGPHGIEAATKGVVGAGLVLVLLSLAVVFSMAAGAHTAASPSLIPGTSFASLGRALSSEPALATAALALIVVAIGLVLGAVPLHQVYVDVAHGSSSSAGSALAAGALIAGTSVVGALVDGLTAAGALSQLALAWSALAALTLAGAPIAALDQSRVGRVAAYLVAVPGGVVLAAAAAAVADPSVGLAASRAGLAAMTSGALGIAAVLLGIAVPRLPPSSTWEDWTGFGRRRPVIAALLLYALGTVAGVPGTVGFQARLDTARAAFAAHLDALGLVVVASAALGAAPLVRLALFLYAKDPPPGRERQADPWGLLLVGSFAILVVVSAALALFPSVLEGIVRAARP